MPDFTLTSDASLRGWSAVELSLRSFLVDYQGQHIRVVSDNTTAVSYMNGMERKSLPCDSIAGNIWSWTIDRGNWLSAAHTPGASNVSAGNLSRDVKADTEWELSNDVFVRLCSLFGVPDIDLFASSLYHKVLKYASWKLDPLASFVDAFTFN